jgi:ATP-dependent helicase/nuclease subunit B
MAKTVFTIPPGTSLVDALAEGLWRQAQGDYSLADTRVFLPTRRACLHLREAFLHRMDKKAALLPRMQPLGDIDEEEFFFTDTDVDTVIPPAITPLRRKLLLAQLIMAKDDSMRIDQAAQLADALAQFLDQAQIMRCDFTKLAALVEEQDLAEHWKQTVAFLEILTTAWPKILTAEGCTDPAERRNRLLETQAAAWCAQPPKFPIIAAGSTGTMPATRDFLDAIASLPSGMVILPGLDQELDEESWQAVTDSHPQHGMKQLLEKFDVKRADVKIWGADKIRVPRARLLQESMRPAEVTEEWRKLRPADIPPEALNGLSRIELNHPQEEAQAIALIMRAALETENKTAALVTPDRDLAERVSGLLVRWGIAANDSGGTSLAACPVGGFLLDVLAAASSDAGAVDYLSLLKHPLAACGLSPAECRAHAREVEISVWRNERSEQSEWLDSFKKSLKPLASLWKKHLPLSEWIAAHIRLAEALAASNAEGGSARLWKGDDGEAAATWLDDWRASAHGFHPLTGEEYQGLFTQLLRAITVRPRYAQHPRLSILGPLEARLIQSDVMILGGLNEGVWPPEAGVDPWMSRPMKKKFGLASPEYRIGLSAHDFVQLASAPEVVLTRARRAGNAPTVPSRFLLQLETVLHALDYQDRLVPREAWQAWAQMLDEPKEITPCAKPVPCPPAASRPTQLSVTEIGTWQRNPYAIYAKCILGLRKLDPLDADIDMADRGTVIHEALDRFIKKYPDRLPQNALEELLVLGRKLFAAYDEHPQAKAFWWPRFERIAAWFAANEQERRAEGIKVLKAEATGKIALNGFTLKGRADRIDRLADGTLAIIDYKTGTTPKAEDVKQGLEPQLPLLALIAEQNGFDGVDAARVGEIAYWKLSGGHDVAAMQPVKGEIEQLSQEARTGLEKLIKKFADPATPYLAVPRPNYRPRYDDYGHLARLAEWGRTGGDE